MAEAELENRVPQRANSRDVIDLYPFIRPLLFALPPEVAHATTLAALRTVHRLHFLSTPVTKSDPVDLMGLRFPNRLGVAAGLDKNGTTIDALGALGFGFVEVGTVTPRPQNGNQRPRLFRLRRDRALVNRMGFPNNGIVELCRRLERRQYDGICGVNIGKNANTSLDAATGDYIAALRAVYRCADYITVNISSPNTADLRRLQHGERLRSLLDPLRESREALAREYGNRKPLLVKLTADLDDSELADAARIVVDCGMDGVIATNTTVRRDRLVDANQKEEGGLSGTPLFARAMHAVACVRSQVGKGFPIVGVGGIESAAGASAMRAAGADLVQVYTGLIYRGPAIIREILKSHAIS